MKRSITLSSGRLDIEVDRADWPLDDLCAFAARENPRRAFLVVSKLLGRHIPTRPSVMRQSFRDLAARIAEDLPGPVLIVGMAETAICLGQGVHEEFVGRTGRNDVLYIHSTRQELDHPILCRFEEPHSHASSHIIYRPFVSLNEASSPRSLVIVDDEISTGTTIANLAAALLAQFPTLTNMTAVTLTDWSRSTDWQSMIAVPVTMVSLLSGSLHCTAQPFAQPASRQFAQAATALGQMKQHYNFGRLGRYDVASEGDSLVDQLTLAPQSRVRLLGTGEFTYPSFRIGERLEAMGHDVVIQSTTRSPVQINDVIQRQMTFGDNYGTQVLNHIYNVDPADGRVTVICHETPRGSVDPLLVELLNAQTLAFGDFA